ncbi:unnamed protein product [Parnassius apollo]|uniref:(apollo) hypothetical protein n=1 Tax=Parnassius apollo TaxID=110799 RepID=A0A8S3Y1P5_PARAO|nr:unnamed protein product [Parnassius apollo]
MFAILSVVVVTVVLAVMVGLYQKNTNAMCKSKKRLDGKTAIITGGTTGMGLRIAIDFADRGAKVIIACPYPDEGASAIKTIFDKTGSEKVIYKYLDLASLESVRKFAADIVNTEDRLDILVNNAGVGIVGDFQTKDGLSFIMQVNYFGHFLLTLLLLPLLKKTGRPLEPSRIVNTSSILHNIGKIDLENLNKTNYWYKVQIYANSKLALVLFARELTCRLRSSKGTHVVINSVDPGAVGTNIFYSVGSIGGVIIKFLSYNLFKTPWQGAQTAIHVVMDKKAGEVSGEFFKNCKRTTAHWNAYNEKVAKQLWAESVRLVKMSDEEFNNCFLDF